MERRGVPADGRPLWSSGAYITAETQANRLGFLRYKWFVTGGVYVWHL